MDASDVFGQGAGRGLLMLARGALSFLRNVLRLTLLAVLLFFEPVVRILLSAAALLALLVAIVCELSAAAPTFPFWGAVGFSAGCFLALVLYEGLLRLLSR